VKRRKKQNKTTRDLVHEDMKKTPIDMQVLKELIELVRDKDDLEAFKKA